MALLLLKGGHSAHDFRRAIRGIAYAVDLLLRFNTLGERKSGTALIRLATVAQSMECRAVKLGKNAMSLVGRVVTAVGGGTTGCAQKEALECLGSQPSTRTTSLSEMMAMPVQSAVDRPRSENMPPSQRNS
jgi:hypothetical protein